MQKIMSNSNKIALIIAPHQDDEIIGCGGLICHLVENGWKVSVVHVFLGCSGVPNELNSTISSEIRHAEAKKAAQIGGYFVLDNLGFVDRDRKKDADIQSSIIKTIRSQQPDIVLLPHAGETDLEHQIVSVSGREASWLSRVMIFPELGDINRKSTKVLYYEVWSNMDNPTLVCDIKRHTIKKRSMLAAFSSQMKDTDWIEGTLGRDRYRGTTLLGSGYAEVFCQNPIDIREIL